MAFASRFAPVEDPVRPCVFRTAPRAAPEDDPRTDVMIFLPQFGSGGVERVACLLANGFRDARLAVRLVCVDDRGPARGVLDPAVRVVRLPLPGVFRGASRTLKQLAGLPALAAEIRRRKPRVLLSPGNHAHLATALAHRLAGVPQTRLVIKMTNPLLRPGRGGVEAWVLRRVYRWLFDRADQVLTLSEGGAERLREMLPDTRAGVSFVHNPYVAQERPSPPGVRRAQDGPPLILAVGRLSKQKNLPLLLAAAARLKDRPWRLAIVGAGPAEASLRALARSLGIANRTVFYGFVADPAPFYRAAHLLALPSLWEDLPAVAVEALSCGCPVLATDCSPALTELVERSGHGRIAPADVAKFSKALDEALSRPFSNLTAPCAHAYSLRRGVDDHLRIIRSLAGELAGRP